MAGHSQNRMSPPPRRVCPKCGKKGLPNKERWTTIAPVQCFKQCCYCQHRVYLLISS